MRARRGYSLVEVLIAAFAVALLLTGLYQLFVAGGNIFMRGEARADLQSSGLKALAGLTEEVRCSALALLTIAMGPSDTPPALAFREQNPNDDSSLIFNPQSFFILYYWDANRQAMMRKTWQTGDPVVLTPDPFVTMRRLTAAEIQRICTTANGSERPVATQCSQMTAAPPTYPVASPVANITVTLQLQSSTSPPATQTVTTTLTPRNKP